MTRTPIREVISDIIVEWISGGNKTFRLNQQMVDSFSNVEINIPFSEYRQPYDHVMLEFPDGRTAFLSVQDNIVIEDGKLHPTLVYADFTYSGAFQGAWCLDDEKSFETSFETEGMTTHEASAVKIRERIALNAMLIACNHPTRVIAAPPVNLNLPKRIVREKQLLRRELIEFIEQDIRWYDIQSSSHPFEGLQDGSEGSPKRPHWRKGHYRRQRIGEGRTERKLIFIKPILINAEYFSGSSSKTVYTAA